MKKILSFLPIVLISLAMNAQKPLRFTSQNSVGLLEGGNGSAFQLQSVNGISSKRFFTGIGAGLDYYYTRSIPLFLSVQGNLTGKSRTPFLSIDGGVNFAWTRKEQDRWNNVITSDYKPGLYFASGLGYKIALRNKKDALLVSVGYSYKHLKEVQTQPVFCIMPPCPPAQETYNYKMNRLLVRLGWEL
jgi:hypothetical protein